MKKYALVIVAVVMVLTASAFVITNTSNTESQSTYWFLMDASGSSVTSTQVSNPDNLCPDKLEDPDCAREYTESQTEIIGGVRQVKASEVNNHIDFRSKD
ncbi:hypothetical protein [Sunxiuqinia indica]|uniref:hypothetical protein n=1 Tax=Sunxiuqinia indica TaxID=2692584 RepID=UPI00135BD841|nr:hypothetical protein [Sunxiuqinia indica]